MALRFSPSPAQTAFTPPLFHHRAAATSSRISSFGSRQNGGVLLPQVISLRSTVTELQTEQPDQQPPSPGQHFNSDDENDGDDRKISDVWRQLHGEDEWAGLLDPMDPLLRSELIRYGEMAQSCYDAFDYDPYSKYCGKCRFPRRQFFQSLGLNQHAAGYDVTKYLFATSNIRIPRFFVKSLRPKLWSPKANWIGYVAVSNDETSRILGRRDIVIAWRGTVTWLEWIADLKDFLEPVDKSAEIPARDSTVKVESGFATLYAGKDENSRFNKLSVREQISDEVSRLVRMYAGRGDEEVSITITGHSLGSALAMLSAYHIAEAGLHVVPGQPDPRICVYSFSGPRVGNHRFRQRMEFVGVKVLRVLNLHDKVPSSPGLIVNEKLPSWVTKLMDWMPWNYSHLGVELLLDHKKSKFLKSKVDPASAHNLEALLHLLDGYHGSGHEFELASGRDLALVNKAADLLKEEHLIPPFWRQDENKGLKMNADGRWMLPQRLERGGDETPDHHRSTSTSSSEAITTAAASNMGKVAVIVLVISLLSQIV